MINDQKYRLCIDGQLLQTTAWNRGMGKYVSSLLKAYVQQYGSSHITIIFNSTLSLEESRREQLKQILPDAEVVSLKLPGLTGDVKTGKKQAKLQYEQFLNAKYSGYAVDFLILNLFTFDYCASFPDGVKKNLLMYDLVPLAYWQDFSHLFGSLYMQHIATVYEADTVFSISEATKHELNRLLGVHPEKIINIGGALIPADDSGESKHPTTEIPGRYFISPTADFPHKNNLNMVRAFNAVNEEFGNSLYLVLTSNFSESSKQLLEAHSENLIFSGGVDNQELNNLYAGSEVVVYLSKDEGLGLPLFEAVEYGKPVVASNIEVFNEISKKAFYYANPDDPGAIENALIDAFVKYKWEDKQRLYASILADFTWSKSSELFAAGLHKQVIVEKKIKKKLSIIMPSPAEVGTKSGQRLQSAYGVLSACGQIRYLVSGMSEDRNAHPYYLQYITHVQPITSLKLRGGKRVDKNHLYGIDDTRASLEVLKAAIACPGYILLDTYKLQKLFMELFEPPVLNALFKNETSHKTATKFLEDIGNIVVYPRVTPNRLHIKPELTGWKLGKELCEILGFSAGTTDD